MDIRNRVAKWPFIGRLLHQRVPSRQSFNLRYALGFADGVGESGSASSASSSALLDPSVIAALEGSNFETASRISLPALNRTTARSGIGTSVPGWFGLRPVRALRTRISKMPKLRSLTFLPLARVVEDTSRGFCRIS